jgi:hypothetical protein
MNRTLHGCNLSIQGRCWTAMHTHKLRIAPFRLEMGCELRLNSEQCQELRSGACVTSLRASLSYLYRPTSPYHSAASPCSCDVRKHRLYTTLFVLDYTQPEQTKIQMRCVP